ncbi:TatD family hydrolase [Polluticaenibacter yanchengensis]|uniref:TatD family hydrolase n=1 Tax=Polluticaenibacter yanchengensis TaxID=3014562 RepID=A0ABT4UQ16_9BACT|nr:TatD family hydrolase [Chitinophagaceae bacterium LY-5]
MYPGNLANGTSECKEKALYLCSMILTDTHTHLYSEQFKDDIDLVMQHAMEQNVKYMFLPAIDSSTHDAMLALQDRYTGNCYAMMGVHPCSVNENYKEELTIAKNWLDKRPFVAVGEIGIDLYWDTTYEKQQIEAFETQMEWALERHLPISIHTRNATALTIDIVRPFAEKGLKGVFHCFGGSVEEATAIVDMDFYLGIGGVVTYKKAALPEVLSRFSLNNIVLETDAPYLSPVPYRGKRNESAYISQVALKLAETFNITIAEVAETTTKNASVLFKTLLL